ncbi:hypothetical protein J2799_001714 [Chryseobacterium vietnamense]|uniref:DUF3945 domain-containing protein n=1 Tax=Chryseobacterium vietnamense TaxID=866785 RepID=UPI00285F4CCE|nr:DUF3945 domain-containing protein [Chryseobacterium vietnamense]MDR6487229.1 hypothetical protein [Chryseobacterium vietnamense]
MQDQAIPPEDILPAAESETVIAIDKNDEGITVIQGLGKPAINHPQPKREEDFIRVDKHGDIFSNFFSNFYRQLKNPSRFNFFRVSEFEPEPVQKEIQNNEQPPENSNKPKNHTTMENTPNTETEYRYTAEQIDWNTMGKLGLNREKLEKLNALDPLLRGFKTNTLVPITLQLGSAVSKMDVRLSLQPSDTGGVSIQLHAIRREPNLNLKFLGHEFTDEDKKNLMENGNMGRVVDLVNPKTDEIIPSVISRDRLTNELVAYRAEYMKIPDEIKGIQLDDHQKQTLLEGKPLYLEGMTSKKRESFDATVQFNADKRYVEFIFNNQQLQQKSQQQTQPQETPNVRTSQSSENEPSKVFRGRELEDKQYEKFKAGETVYVDGLTDSKGKAYQGYITFNKETSKTEFSFTNPNKLKENAQPAEDHKTQKAVNSDGRTNEATKNIKEPLQSKQQQPANKQQEEQQKKPAKSKGRKI